MIHEILPVGMLQCNCSIFGDEQSREALVVDPGDDIASILEVVERHGLTVKAIVITHAHIDHIGGAQKLKQATGAPVYMNPDDAELQEMMDVQAGWLGVRPPEPVEIDAPARDGDKLVVGATEFAQIPLLNQSQLVARWKLETPPVIVSETQQLPIEGLSAGVYLIEATDGARIPEGRLLAARVTGPIWPPAKTAIQSLRRQSPCALRSHHPEIACFCHSAPKVLST